MPVASLRFTSCAAVLGLTLAAAASRSLAQPPESPRTPPPSANQNQPNQNQPNQNQPNQPAPGSRLQPGQIDPERTGTPRAPAVNRGNLAGNTVFVRATQVVGMEVRESTGQQRVGLIADLLLTPDAGLPAVDVPAADRAAAANNAAQAHWQNFRDCDLRLALIQVDNVGGDRVVVVPWDLLQFQGSYFILGFPQERIAEAPSVLLDDPRILQSDEWMQQVSRFFADDLQRIQQQRGAAGQGLPGRTVPGAAGRQPTPVPDTAPQPGARTPRPDANRPDRGQTPRGAQEQPRRQP
jgi:hypothetical protein